jgi:hypothetical protein
MEHVRGAGRRTPRTGVARRSADEDVVVAVVIEIASSDESRARCVASALAFDRGAVDRVPTSPRSTVPYTGSVRRYATPPPSPGAPTM